MAMTVLITGGSSLLGKALLETAIRYRGLLAPVPEQFTVEATWYSNPVAKLMYRLDVTKDLDVDYIFERVKPDVVIHCVGSAIDYVQRNFSLTRSGANIEIEGTRNILRAAREYGAKVIYISSGTVFGGDCPPYGEDDLRSPVNLYGWMKCQAEDMVMAADHWLIIRPHLLYGWPWPKGRSNLGKDVVQNLARGRKIRIVEDKMTQPLYVRECAEAIWRLVGLEEESYHVAGAEVVSFFEFAKMVARVWGFDEGLITPVGSDEMPTIAPRPEVNSYDLSKIYGLGIKPGGIEEGLSHMKAEWEETEKYNHSL